MCEEMKIEQNQWYLVKSVAGGSVLLAKAKCESTFPLMEIEVSYDLSSLLCSETVNMLKNCSLNLCYSTPYENEVPNNPDKDFEQKCCDIIQYIERI